MKKTIKTIKKVQSIVEQLGLLISIKECRLIQDEKGVWRKPTYYQLVAVPEVANMHCAFDNSDFDTHYLKLNWNTQESDEPQLWLNLDLSDIIEQHRVLNIRDKGRYSNYTYEYSSAIKREYLRQRTYYAEKPLLIKEFIELMNEKLRLYSSWS